MQQSLTLLSQIIEGLHSEADIVEIQQSLEREGYLTKTGVSKSSVPKEREPELLAFIAERLKQLSREHPLHPHYIWYSSQFYKLTAEHSKEEENFRLFKIKENRQKLEYVRYHYYAWTFLHQKLVDNKSALDFLVEMHKEFSQEDFRFLRSAGTELQQEFYRYGQELFSFLLRLILDQKKHWKNAQERDFLNQLLQKIFPSAEHPVIEQQQANAQEDFLFPGQEDFTAVGILQQLQQINQDLEKQGKQQIPLFKDEALAYYLADIIYRTYPASPWLEEFLQFDPRKLYYEEQQIHQNVGLLIRINLLQGKIAQDRKKFSQALECYLTNIAIYLDSFIEQQTGFIAEKLKQILEKDSSQKSKLWEFVENIEERSIQQELEQVLKEKYGHLEKEIGSIPAVKQHLQQLLTLNDVIVKKIVYLALLIDLDPSRPKDVTSLDSRKGWLALTKQAGTVDGKHTLIEELWEALHLIAPKFHSPPVEYQKQEMEEIHTLFSDWSQRLEQTPARYEQLEATMLCFRENMHHRINQFKGEGRVDYGNIEIYLELTQIALCHCAIDFYNSQKTEDVTVDPQTQEFLESLFQGAEDWLKSIEEQKNKLLISTLAIYYRILYEKAVGKQTIDRQEFIRRNYRMKSFYPALHENINRNLLEQ